MKIVNQDAQIINFTPNPLETIERAGRNCYKSTSFKFDNFLTKRMYEGHWSIFEHANLTAHLITDRAALMELTRHRLAAYSVESTRWCNYSQGRFGHEICVVWPIGFDQSQLDIWEDACRKAEKAYFQLLDADASPGEARAVLPNSLKTEIVMTANFREWRHIFDLRTSKAAHPQIRSLMLDLKKKVAEQIPLLFND